MTASILSCIDEIVVGEETLEIAGWVLGRPPVRRLSLSGPGSRGLTRKLETYGLSSPDVAAALGPDGAAVRFHEVVSYPPHLTFQELAKIEIGVDLASSGKHALNICSPDALFDAVTDRPLSEISLGIGVTSFNRWSTLSHTIGRIQRHTKCKYDLVVADDGSTDGTRQNLVARGIECIGMENKGIAWNKNRCLFYLNNVKRCDVIILLEDDTFPEKDRWETDWILAALMYGHINFLTPWLRSNVKDGTGKWHKPYRLEDRVSGQCSAFSSQALAWVGYMDTRFGQYGHEHVEHTLRMIRAGYGGYTLGPSTRSSCFYALEGHVAVTEIPSHGTADQISANGRIFDEIWNEGIHRPAWRNDLERATLRNDVFTRRRHMSRHESAESSEELHLPISETNLQTERSTFSPSPPMAQISGSSFWMTSFHGTFLYYDSEERCIRHGSGQEVIRNLVLRIDEEGGKLFVLGQGSAETRPIFLDRTGRSVHGGSDANLYVHPLSEGKAALILDGKLLCCEPDKSRLAFDRIQLSDWETYRLEPVSGSRKSLGHFVGELVRREGSIGAGLTLVGNFSGYWSLAAVNRRLALSLEEALPGFCRIQPRDKLLPAMPMKRIDKLVELVKRLPQGERQPIVIHQGWPMMKPTILGDLTLCYFFWEESLIPASMVEVLNSYDAILTPAETVQNALIMSGCVKPTYNVGYSPDLDDFIESAALRGNGSEAKTTFTFLHVSAGDARKGVDVLLRAYLSTFCSSDYVRLIIKAPSQPVRDQVAKACDTKPSPGAIEVIDRELDTSEMCALYRRADVMVLPTRGEGFNVPAAEAIAAGLPLIVTGFGGHMQFCKSGVARLLRYAMSPSPVFAQLESLWAEPDTDDLCLAMQEARSGLIRVDNAVRADVLESLERRTWTERLLTVIDALLSKSQQVRSTF